MTLRLARPTPPWFSSKGTASWASPLIMPRDVVVDDVVLELHSGAVSVKEKADEAMVSTIDSRRIMFQGCCVDSSREVRGGRRRWCSKVHEVRTTK